LGRGQRLQEVLKHPQYQPVELSHQVAVLFAVTNGFADNIAVEDISIWEAALLRNLDSTQPDLLQDISDKKLITDETRSKLEEAISDFNRTYQS
jgi:F-type H+-transporting ATPase subunit alpha